MREFDTGATRNLDASKLDYEGFLSPLVLERFAEYMHANRQQADGKLRDSDNWQKGIPSNSYMKSGWRHFFDWWKGHRGLPASEDVETACCALLFNVQGYLHEHLKAKAARNAADPATTVAHHATDAPMPPFVAEIVPPGIAEAILRDKPQFDPEREDDTGEPYPDPRPNPVSQEDEE